LLLLNTEELVPEIANRENRVKPVTFVPWPFLRTNISCQMPANCAPQRVDTGKYL